ncbi:Calcineurin-like phosphoesterase [Bremerella volcania]|uniref:Calcineurin-like phosphoesterase n=1 Tax=Bremerella volcania TaxID=2527984 RepID=A0A518CC62_9BACT|nr:metallophosphoesterase [Bremerella volcania]QDU76813.1 Calcineurin-like phosphoesterase [Bremerella volcania]
MTKNRPQLLRIQLAIVVKLTLTLMISFMLNPSRISAATENSKPVKAYVWDHQDKWTNRTGSEQLLIEAGFDVELLPMDKSPWGLTGLIFIGSFASEDPAYQDYMKEYSEDLYKFVDDGNVLVQMTQADQTEDRPPFLPTTLKARRCDVDSSEVYVLSPSHTLVNGMPIAKNKLEITQERLGWETFDRQGGFEVILSSDAGAGHPILMEGAYGQGRIILGAMHIDKSIDADGNRVDEPQRQGLARHFARNLLAHVQDVDDRKAKAIEVTLSPRVQRGFVEGSWTLALLPDTQVYSLRYPGLFSTQTAWLRAHAKQRNIQYVLHLGDITNNNTRKEWERASESMRLLDDQVPYALVGGNHDYGPSGDASTRKTFLNEYFSFEKMAEMPGFGGAFEDKKLDNTFHLFEVAGQKWIIIALEWGPRDEVIAWANDVMKRHADRRGILVTHAYMYSDSRRYDHTDPSHPNHWNPHNYRTPRPVNDGQQLWDKLVRKHNFVFTFNGHVLNDGTGYRADRNDQGQLVHQILANYQMRELGGEGYMRLLEFDPDGNTVHMMAYSPLHDSYMLAGDHTFTIKLDQAPSDQPEQNASEKESDLKRNDGESISLDKSIRPQMKTVKAP